jgi:hypothetical protein
MCSADWPLEDTYQKCPECGEDTSAFHNVKAMPRDEAIERVKQAKFEKFYAAWDASHPAERLSTDDLPQYQGVRSGRPTTAPARVA